MARLGSYQLEVHITRLRYLLPFPPLLTNIYVCASRRGLPTGTTSNSEWKSEVWGSHDIITMSTRESMWAPGKL
jgi:hypothetical protein